MPAWYGSLELGRELAALRDRYGLQRVRNDLPSAGFYFMLKDRGLRPNTVKSWILRHNHQRGGRKSAVLMRQRHRALNARRKKKRGFKALLKRLGIPRTTAYRWIRKFEKAIGGKKKCKST